MTVKYNCDGEASYYIIINNNRNNLIRADTVYFRKNWIFVHGTDFDYYIIFEWIKEMELFKNRHGLISGANIVCIHHNLFNLEV